MFGIGPMELVVIVVVALLIFGPQRLPEFARNLGKGLAEFRRASNELRQTLALDDLQNDLRKTMNAPPAKPVPPRPAQAGDSLPPGSAAGAAPTPTADTTAAPLATSAMPTTPTSQASPPKPADAAGTNAASAPNAAAEPPWKNHPGELPLGREHEHHDPAPEAGSTSAPGPRLAAIDSDLGNVPVTGADPSGPRRG